MRRILTNALSSVIEHLLCLLALTAVLFGVPLQRPIPTLPFPPNNAPVPVQVRVGGISSDGVISYVVTVSAATVRNANGSQVGLFSTPFSVEVMHLAGDSEPVLVGTLPRGQYTQATLVITAAKMTYLDPLTGLLVQKQSSLNLLSTLQFSPVLSVVSSPVVLNFQVALPTVSNASGARNAAPKPVVNVSSKAVNTAGRQKPEDGQVQRVVGLVTKTSGTSFSLRNGLSGSLLNFQTNTGTQFINTTLSTLNNLIVSVYGSSRRDGSLLAQTVEAVANGTGIELEGLVATTIPNSNAMGLVFHDASGPGMDSGMMGSTVSVDTTVLPNFAIDTQNVDMTGLDSLTFDINSFVPGQRVQLQSVRQLQQDLYGNNGLVAPDTVRLEPQALTGTVANYQPGNTPGTASFDLLLPTDGTAYLTILNPNTSSVHIYQQMGTDLKNLSNGISNGAQVQVRGLLFFSQLPASAADREFVRPTLMSREPVFVMVAGRIIGN